MPQTITTVSVQEITGEPGAFLGPDIATPGAAGTYSDTPVTTVKVACTQTPKPNFEYQIKGNVDWGAPPPEAVTLHKMYYTETENGQCVFAAIIPT